MKSSNDKRIILTLDAGGTNFVFSAIRGNKQVLEPVIKPSNARDLNKCLEGIIEGFEELSQALPEAPVAISFAFPGPADYPNGIIGDLSNLPAFRGGVALGPMLEEKFAIPVYINNDGDLFAYGEAIAGLLPAINEELKQNGIPKQYKNLLGITLGTGFGAGIVNNGELYLGDNSAGAEIWISRNSYSPSSFAEESISIRGVQREYFKRTGNTDDRLLTPKDICDIAMRTKEGDTIAARQSFKIMGSVLGDVLANAITLLDCNVVIGGGLSNAYELFAPSMIAQLNGKISTYNGTRINRLEVKAFDLEDEKDRLKFYLNEPKIIKVPNSNKEVSYNLQKQIGVGLSKLGTSYAVAVGAYAFALSKLDEG
jgi:glucokinase